MIRFDAWNKERLSFDELPTVRDVLSIADVSLIADARMPICMRAAAFDHVDPPTMTELWEETETIVRNLLSVQEIPGSDEYVLIPSTTIHENYSFVDVFYASAESVLVRRESLALYARYLEDVFAKRSFEDTCKLPPNGYAYEDSSWEVIMSFRVYVPERMCELELYQFLADVLENATFHGTDVETVNAERLAFVSKLDEARKDVEAAISDGNVDRYAELVKTFKLADYGITDNRPHMERDYASRIATLYTQLDCVGRMELYQDCVDLAKRLV